MEDVYDWAYVDPRFVEVRGATYETDHHSGKIGRPTHTMCFDKRSLRVVT